MADIGHGQRDLHVTHEVVEMGTEVPATVSWGAILAGVAGALVVHLLLNLLGVGIGAASMDAYSDLPQAETFSWTAYGWWTASGVISALVGGMIAGWLAGRSSFRMQGLGHGLMSWAVSVLIVSTTLMMIAGGATSLVTSAAGPFMSMVQSATNNTQDQAPSGQPPGQTENQNQQQIARLMSQGLSKEQAETAIGTATRLRAADVRQAADEARVQLAQASLYSFGALILGAIAAACGGAWAASFARNREVYDD